MKKLQKQKGFTLVELAIVLTIIGLLIGGILKGQALVANAEVTAQIAQFKSVEAAMTSFNDQYAALPGDMLLASTRLPPNCGGAACGNGNGDAVIGAASATPTAAAGENTLFWQHLSAANLISGISGTAQTFGSSLPSGKFTGSGLIATTITGAPYGGGLWATLLASPTVTTAAAGTGILTPSQAAQIDRKLDDGQALTGSVIASGLAATCTAVAPTGYNEGKASKDCLVSYKAQN